jgi:hypothetical protein
LPPGITVVQGGPASAYRSIQALGYTVPASLRLKLGWAKVGLAAPAREPGRRGAIGFTRDTEDVTPYDINLKKHKTSTSHRRKLVKRKQQTTPELLTLS